MSEKIPLFLKTEIAEWACFFRRRCPGLCSARFRIQSELEAFAHHPDLWFAIISAGWVALLYRHGISGGFVYDDVAQIQNNPALAFWHSAREYARSAIPFNGQFRGIGGSFYRPLFWFSLALDRFLWGLNATGFHLTNLALHWGNGLLAFLLLKRLNVSSLLSASVCITWLSLPINCEVVAWISGRSIALAVLFLLTSLLSADWYFRSHRTVALLGYAIAALASLLSHEIGILTLPMTCLLVCSVNAKRRNWFVLWGVGLAVDAVYLYIRHTAGGHLSSSTPGLLGISMAFWKYTAWMLLPIRMSIERSTDVPLNNSPTAAAAAFVGVLALFITFLQLRHKMPEVAAGLAWLFIALVPFCGVVPIYQGMAERYTYLAALGLVLAIVGLLSRLKNGTRSLALCTVVVWLLWGVWRLNARVLDWRQEISIYAKSLAATPRSSVLLYNLGLAFAERGDNSRAADYYQRAIGLNPGYTSAIINLANVFQRQGNYPQSAALYQKAIRLDPQDPDAWVNLGNLYLQLALTQQAKNAYENAIALKPNDVEAILGLGAMFQRSGNFSDAEQAYRHAVAVDPTQASAYCDLGALFLQEGNLAAAGKELTRAIEHNSSYAPAYFDLGVLYEQMGRRNLAIEMYKKTLDIQPNYQHARSNLERMEARPGASAPESYP
ncbi:MAG TPA: tetratricopeptide repeat protein [Candidatus Sulfotelmatobacter sp.]